MKKLNELIRKIGHNTRFELDIGDILTIKEAHIKYRVLEAQLKNMRYAIEEDPKFLVTIELFDKLREDLEK